MKIAFCFNQKREAGSGEDPDKWAEFDAPETVEAIKKAIESLGHGVIKIDSDDDAFEKLRNSGADLVFNLAEGIRGESRESQIPLFCEMLGIPYTASGPLTLAITLDKARTKEILTYYGVPNPRFRVFRNPEERLAGLKFPLLVKPIGEGSSKGIKNDSLVKNEGELRKKLRRVLEEYKQPAIAEEFLDGKEFTVAIIGNDPPEVLPIVEVTFDYLPPGIHHFDSYEVKWIYDNPQSKIDPVICPAKIPKELENKIKETCVKAFRVLDCRDLCRIDVRLDSRGVPNIIEVNALPGLIPDPKENSRFPKAAYAAGMKYEDIFRRVIDAAKKRYGMN